MQDGWEIRVEGFGPFARQASWTIAGNPPKAALYAGNGQGKTCLSRLLRASEAGAQTLPDTLVSRGSETGRFTLDVTEEGQHRGTLTVSKEPGAPAQVDDRTGLIPHVFNADYVQQNLAQRHFAPSGDIRGYLMGRQSIELDEKRQRLADLGERGKEQRRAVDEAVDRARADLKALGISPRFKEFGELSCEHILQLPLAPNSYDECLHDFQTLRSLPDDTRVEMVMFSHTHPDFPMIEELLATSYTRDLFSEAFLAAASQKKPFIAQGLGLMRGDTCPFCGQDLGDQARALIHLYEDYLGGREALVVDTLESEARSLSGLKEAYYSFARSYQQRKDLHKRLCAAFAELEGSSLPSLAPVQAFDAAVDALAEALRDKATDISCAYATAASETLRDMLRAIDLTVVEANELIAVLNRTLQRSSARLRDTKRALCREAAKRVRLTCKGPIDELMRLRKDYGRLRTEIHREEAVGNRSKRDAVADLLEWLLQLVFADKYRLDRQSFSLVFQSSVLGDGAEHVLSDGEKAAVAFCHFVATTMELLETEDDAERLLFVIDDPVVGLDGPHAQQVAGIIRGLGEVLGLDRLRLLVLTHDASCFQMLLAEGTPLTGYVLENGRVGAVAREAMP